MSNTADTVIAENQDLHHKPFRILCLEGGGIRGIISACILKEVEKQLWEMYKGSAHETEKIYNTPLVRHFDMIAGTSTGALLAAGLATGMTSEDLIEIYEDHGKEIFPYQSRWSPQRLKLMFKFGSFSVPKFSNEGLIKLLTGNEMKNFQIKLKEVGRTEEEAKNHKSLPKPILLIPAYDATYRNTTFLNNYHPGTGGQVWYDNLPLWEVCLASAAAPTYFPAWNLRKGKEIDKSTGEPWSFPHVDGGVTANNPALCAITHALVLGYRLEDIQLLSIGTGKSSKPLRFNDINALGLAGWALHITDVFMEGQAELQSHICRQLLGGKSSHRYLGLQFDLNECFGPPPEASASRRILPKSRRRNIWLGKHLSESMDDATTQNIKNLKAAAEEYLERGNLYENRFGNYGKVKQAIKDFFVQPESERKHEDPDEPQPRPVHSGFWQKLEEDCSSRGYAHKKETAAIQIGRTTVHG